MKKLFFAILVGTLGLMGCSGEYNRNDFANGGEDAPFYNERTSTFMQSDNEYAGIDSYRPKTDKELDEMETKWMSALWNNCLVVLVE